jgi:hypothetical protein
MTTFNWTISAVERKVSEDGLSNVIQVAHWRYRGTDENGVTAELYGAQSLAEPNPEDFTPWDEVTAEDVEGWLVNIFSVTVDGEPSELDKMEANIDVQIELIINPVTITGPLVA